MQAGSEASKSDTGFIGKYGPTIASGLAMFSDRRLKKKVRKINATKGLDKLDAYTYEYKDPRHGQHVFLTTSPGTLVVVNIDDPYKPREVARWTTAAAWCC